MNVSQKQAARKFVERWTFRRGSEKGEDQQFWNSLLGEVLGMEDVASRVQYQVPVPMKGTTKFLDAWIPETRVLIEHKSRGVNLDAPQTGHDGLTPYEQAAEYDAARPFDEKARWIVTCNFDEFRIYDRVKPLASPMKVRLGDLPKEAHRLAFLVNPKEKAIDRELEISVQAGRIVGEIYDALLKQYGNEDASALAALNRLCVRLVFCLYAEDADIFPKDCFRRLVENTPAPFLRDRLLRLFQTLDTPSDKRAPYLEPELCAFPYTNGGLFRTGGPRFVAANADGTKPVPPAFDDIPPLTDEVRKLLIGASQFDWHDITPTIFGALFESTLNPVTRRAGGMVYTSVENIHKVIDPLFLDDLTRRVEAAIKKGDKRSLLALQAEMASITFLDPACGSGNFLTETYICLRRLENRIIAALQKGQGEFDLGLTIKVSIAQFYGLEINDFAVAVAKTALWIAESQMMEETAAILHREPDYLPLKDNANIVECNALRANWPTTSFIIGNPPFLGYSSPGMTAESKADLADLFPKAKFLDYVCCWYKKAAALMQGTATRCAFVSTNSITQGEQVAPLWKDLNCEIDFAHRSFIWDNEATEKAHVHCVIIGFHAKEERRHGVMPPYHAAVGRDDPIAPQKIIYDNGKAIPAKHINGYLMDADDVYIESRSNPICTVSPLVRGCQPTDDGNLILSEGERTELLARVPQVDSLIRPYMMGSDFIQRKPRYCLWLVNASPALLRSSAIIMERITKVREFRLKSTKAATRRKAETPTLFDDIREPQNIYIAIPKVSSQRRKYIPIDMLSPEILPGDMLFVMENASPYDFGILTSSVHMALMRATCGRLKSDYRYSAKLCYNSFVWPSVTDDMREKISGTAQSILDARAAHPESSLADLYDPLTMPADLRAAHAENDRAVLAAYGLAPDTPEPEIVAHLFKLYSVKTKNT